VNGLKIFFLKKKKKKKRHGFYVNIIETTLRTFGIELAVQCHGKTEEMYTTQKVQQGSNFLSMERILYKTDHKLITTNKPNS
jgi:hypothetical protein